MTNNDTNSLEKLWGDGFLRAFISHKADHKMQATEIQQSLRYNGIASFVAHEDIEPTKEWQSEIERALFSMHVFVALLTKEFSDSVWTDQEVGVAVGRKVFIIPVRLGKDPYGFIGKYQAISGINKSDQQISDEIYEVILKNDDINEDLKSSIKAAHNLWKNPEIDDYIAKVSRSNSFDQSNQLAEYLPQIERLSPRQEEALVQAFHRNHQVNQAFGWEDIATELKRMTGHDYERTLEGLSKPNRPTPR